MEELFKVEKSSNILACPLDSIQDSDFKFGFDILNATYNDSEKWKLL